MTTWKPPGFQPKTRPSTLAWVSRALRRAVRAALVASSGFAESSGLAVLSSAFAAPSAFTASAFVVCRLRDPPPALPLRHHVGGCCFFGRRDEVGGVGHWEAPCGGGDAIGETRQDAGRLRAYSIRPAMERERDRSTRRRRERRHRHGRLERRVAFVEHALEK